MPQAMRFGFAATLGVIVGIASAEGAHFAWRWHLARNIRPVLIAQGMEAGRHAAFVERAHADGIDLLFLGDSLTDWFKDAPAWSRFAGPHTANYGMVSDTCAGMLWRIQQGEIDGLSPHVIVVQIGTNDLGGQDNVRIIVGIRAVVAAVRSRCPSSRVLLLGIFPRNDGGDARLARIRAINRELALTGGVTFMDVGDVRADHDGHLAVDCAAADGVHITPEGYRRWANEMGPAIDRLTAEFEVRKTSP